MKKKPKWRVIKGKVTHWIKTQWWYFKNPNPDEGDIGG